MEWLELAKAIAELGILIVIAAIFLVIMIRTNNDAKEKSQQLFDFAMDKLKEQTNPHVLTEEEDSLANKIDKSINSYLQSMVQELGPSRAVVIRYHNGGRDMSGISFLKLSITNEQVAQDTTPIIGEFQAQFRSVASYICDELEEKGYCYIDNLEVLKNKDSGTYELLKLRDGKSCFARALKSRSGYVIGAIMVTYTSKSIDKKPDVEKIDRTLVKKANEISALLNFKEC